MNFKIIIILLAIVLGGMFFIVSGSVAANEGSSEVRILPGSFWYPFKMLWEDVVTFFTFNDLSLANRYMDLAEERLREVRVLEIEKNYEQAKKTLVRYQNTLQKTKETIALAKQSGEDVRGVIDRGVKFVDDNRDTLQSVYDNVPDELKKLAKDALDKTEVSKKDWLNALKNQVQDQLFNQGRENTKDLKQLNNDFKDSIIPKVPNLKNMLVQ